MIPPGGFTIWHTYGVDWQTSYAQWSIDGVKSLHINSSVPTVPMYININAYSTIPLDVDWVRVRQRFTPEPSVSLAVTHIEYETGECEMISVPYDTGHTSYWKYIIWEGTTPTDALLTLDIRTADTQEGLSLASWVPYPQQVQVITNPPGRWVQYRVTLSRTDNPLITPQFNKVTIYFSSEPTDITLSSFGAITYINTVQLDWETANEVDLVGFNLYRSEASVGEKIKLNSDLIQAQNSGQMIGAIYQFDDMVIPGQHYYYWLELVMKDGTDLFGPLEINSKYWNLAPLTLR